jgi:acyl phosphate:glycerol-3-phosphate acyltransferase
MFILFLILIILAYLAGSVSSAIIVSQVLGLPDPRLEGSKNPGATNVMRVGGRMAGVYVLLGDLLKGFLPVFVAHLLNLKIMALGFIGLAAVLGHIFPVFFGFKGGKGIATGLGALLGVSIMLGLMVGIVWLAVVIVTRYVSLGSIIASVAALILSILFVGIGYFMPCLIMVAFIVWRHSENIERLRSGSENKISKLL